MHKEPKVNPTWFVLLGTFIAGCIMIYVKTGDISAVIAFVVDTGILFVASAILLFATAFCFAVVYAVGVFLWLWYRRLRIPKT